MGRTNNCASTRLRLSVVDIEPGVAILMNRSGIGESFELDAGELCAPCCVRRRSRSRNRRASVSAPSGRRRPRPRRRPRSRVRPVTACEKRTSKSPALPYSAAIDAVSLYCSYCSTNGNRNSPFIRPRSNSATTVLRHPVVETVGVGNKAQRNDLFGHAEIVEHLQGRRVQRRGALILDRRLALLLEHGDGICRGG